MSFADICGPFHGFNHAMSDHNTLIGSVLSGALASFLFDIFELVTRPDMRLNGCYNEEPELPLE